MIRSSSSSSLSSPKKLQKKLERGAGREVWLDTFYYSIPFNLSNMNQKASSLHEVKTPYLDLYLGFQFERIKELDFLLTCERTMRNSIPHGDYKFQFLCDINLFDEPTKVLEMKSNEYVVFHYYSLSASYKEESSIDLMKLFEFKILVKMFEYDSIFGEPNLLARNIFRITSDQIFNNDAVLTDLCYILNDPRLENIFIGRQNSAALSERSEFVKKTAFHSRKIADYLQRCQTEVPPPGFPDLDHVLHYILHGSSGAISDRDVIVTYIKGRYLSLKFLIDLSRTYMLEKLAEYEAVDIVEYERYMFLVLKAAVSVHDDALFDKVIVMLTNARNFFDPANLLAKLENSSIDSRFVMLYSNRKLKKLSLNGR